VVHYDYVTGNPSLLEVAVERSTKLAFVVSNRWNGHRTQLQIPELGRLSALTRQGAVSQELDRIDMHLAALRTKLAKLEETRAKVAVLDLPAVES
jgi:hypothetical protein